MRYKDKWDDLTKKMGYWVDLNDPYITFDNNYIETLLVPAEQTVRKRAAVREREHSAIFPRSRYRFKLARAEPARTYKMVKDTSAVVMFKASEGRKISFPV